MFVPNPFYLGLFFALAAKTCLVSARRLSTGEEFDDFTYDNSYEMPDDFVDDVPDETDMGGDTVSLNSTGQLPEITPAAIVPEIPKETVPEALEDTINETPEGTAEKTSVWTEPADTPVDPDEVIDANGSHMWWTNNDTGSHTGWTNPDTGSQWATGSRTGWTNPDTGSQWAAGSRTGWTNPDTGSQWAAGSRTGWTNPDSGSQWGTGSHTGWTNPDSGSQWGTGSRSGWSNNDTGSQWAAGSRGGWSNNDTGSQWATASQNWANYDAYNEGADEPGQLETREYIGYAPVNAADYRPAKLETRGYIGSENLNKPNEKPVLHSDTGGHIASVKLHETNEKPVAQLEPRGYLGSEKLSEKNEEPVSQFGARRYTGSRRNQAKSDELTAQAQSCSVHAAGRRGVSQAFGATPQVALIASFPEISPEAVMQALRGARQGAAAAYEAADKTLSCLQCMHDRKKQLVKDYVKPVAPTAVNDVIDRVDGGLDFTLAGLKERAKEGRALAEKTISDIEDRLYRGESVLPASIQGRVENIGKAIGAWVYGDASAETAGEVKDVQDAAAQMKEGKELHEVQEAKEKAEEAKAAREVTEERAQGDRAVGQSKGQAGSGIGSRRGSRLSRFTQFRISTK